MRLQPLRFHERRQKLLTMPDDIPTLYTAERSDLEPVPDCLIKLGFTTITPELWALAKELSVELPPLSAAQRERLRLIFRATP